MRLENILLDPIVFFAFVLPKEGGGLYEIVRDLATVSFVDSEAAEQGTGEVLIVMALE